MSASTGPAFALLPYRGEDKLDTSLRALVDYDIGTDTHCVRLDILKSRTQFNIGFHVRKTGNWEAGGNELRMPNRYNGFSVMANSQDLIDALRGMADRLEQQLKDDVERMKP